MSYFEDGTYYSYAKSEPGAPPELNVGWLSAAHPFPTADPSEELLDALWSFCRYTVQQMRGFHLCEFCDLSALKAGRFNLPPIRGTLRHGEELRLGSAEIRVFAKDGARFAAPNLIYHYVAEHRYDPPEDFKAAFFEGPAAGSEEYRYRLSYSGYELRSSLMERPR